MARPELANPVAESMAKPMAGYLGAFRRAAAPPDERKHDNLQAIRARIADGERIDDDAEDGDVVPTPETRAAFGDSWTRRAAAFVVVVKPLALSVTVAAASLAAIKGGVVTWRALQTERPQVGIVEEPAPLDDAPAAATQDQPAPAVAPTPPVPAQPELPATPAPEARVADPPPTTTRRSPTPAADKAAIDDRLRRETALMRRAKAELESEQWQKLLSTLATHATEFPDGVLKNERAAWRSVARCRLGQGDATATLQAFVRDYPRDSLVQKVRRACTASTK